MRGICSNRSSCSSSSSHLTLWSRRLSRRAREMSLSTDRSPRSSSSSPPPPMDVRGFVFLCFLNASVDCHHLVNGTKNVIICDSPTHCLFEFHFPCFSPIKSFLILPSSLLGRIFLIFLYPRELDPFYLFPHLADKLR